jgi:Skp family chaperone for outer membrane proteins
MNKLLVLSLLILSVMSTASTNALAQNQDAAVSADHTAPSYDMKAQSLVDLERVQKKFVDLLDVVPAD